MKNNLHFLFAMLTLLEGSNLAAAQGASFFRISGPAATAIIAFRPDGTLVWSNALTGTNYTIQTATSLAGGGNWVDYEKPGPPGTPITNTKIIDPNPPAGMAFIPAGWFTMGDSLGDAASAGIFDETPLHTVDASAFYMDQNAVTLGLWQQVYNWAVSHGYSFANPGSGEAANQPVEMINWYDCVKWCNARSEMERRTPAYYTNGEQTVVYRSGEIDLDNSCVNWNAGYRLPTESEWEKAARGGLGGQRFPWGNIISWNWANYIGDPYSPYRSGGYTYDLGPGGYNPAFDDFTSPVGSFVPNGYGLYDMAGNVWQWCWDWYGLYSSDPQTDPRGSTSSYFDRVIRGGAWNSDAFGCRTAYRAKIVPGFNSWGLGASNVGFRSVLSPDQ